MVYTVVTTERCSPVVFLTALQLIDYLNNGSVMVNILGKQYIRKSAVAARRGLTTKDMLKTDRGVFSRYLLLLQCKVVRVILSKLKQVFLVHLFLKTLTSVELSFEI